MPPLFVTVLPLTVAGDDATSKESGVPLPVIVLPVITAPGLLATHRPRRALSAIVLPVICADEFSNRTPFA